MPPAAAYSWKWRAPLLLRKLPPPRNVYFASVTAEEQGLLGSKYLGMHPPEPIRDFTLDLNFDELLPIGVPTSVEVSGSERTSFYPVVEKTAAAFGLEIQPDAAPMAGIYYRSDHFSLARVGVPAFSVDEGTISSPAIRRNGASSRRRTTTTSDTIAPPTNTGRIWTSAPMPDWLSSGSY